jgi:peptide deformylase
MILEVLRFPDPRLRKKAKPVDKVTPELKTLAENMLETMYEFRGIGLAATQVGQELRLLVMDTRPKENGRYKTEDFTELELTVKQPVVIFNPEIIAKAGETTFDEGCLSVPGYFETVSRYDYVEVQGLDENGETIVIKTDGLLSVCLQHEMDHLEGKLFIDRLSIIRANRLKNKIKKNGYPKPEDLMNHEEEESI